MIALKRKEVKGESAMQIEGGLALKDLGNLETEELEEKYK